MYNNTVNEAILSYQGALFISDQSTEFFFIHSFIHSFKLERQH